MQLAHDMRLFFRQLLRRNVDPLDGRFWRTIVHTCAKRSRLGRPVSREFFHETLRLIDFRPWNFSVQATDKCNSRCVFCAYRPSKKHGNHMGLDAFRVAIGEYAAMGGGNLMIRSILGEPLLDPTFVEKVKIARSHATIDKIHTVSNFSELSGFTVRDMIDSGISSIKISVAAFDESTYETVYRNGRYRNMRANVRELLAENTRRGCPITVTIAFRSGLPMRKLVKMPDYQALKEYPHRVIMNFEFASWRGHVKQKDLGPGMLLRSDRPVEPEPCLRIYEGPFVFADGSVSMCGHMNFSGHQDLIIGNIRHEGLASMWRGERANAIRRRYWDNDFPEPCRTCGDYTNLDFYRTKRGFDRARQLQTLAKRSTQYEPQLSCGS